MPLAAGVRRRTVDLRHRVTGAGHRMAGPRLRGWLCTAAVVVALAALVTTGATGVLLRGPTPVQLARADAVRQARADHNVLFNPERPWTAEQLGRRASLLRGTQLLTVTGVDSAWSAGVQLVVRVVGHSGTQPPVDAPVCFDLRFGRGYRSGVTTVACPDTPPLGYPPLPPPAALPAGKLLRGAVAAEVQDAARHLVATGTTYESALRTAVSALHLDPRIAVSIGRAAGVGGLALDTYDSSTYSYTCVLLRVSTDGIDIWHLAPPVPGENPRCTGHAAATATGFHATPAGPSPSL